VAVIANTRRALPMRSTCVKTSVLAVLLTAGLATTADAGGSTTSPRSASRAEHCQPPSEFVPRLCTLSLPAIRSIVVELNARASAVDAVAFSECARFILSPRDVRRFFALARRVDDPHPEHALDRGPCYAEGRVAFVDGREGRWRIEQIGSGTLSIGGAQLMALMCVHCNWPPF
jgi:hypothetical protein